MDAVRPCSGILFAYYLGLHRPVPRQRISFIKKSSSAICKVVSSTSISLMVVQMTQPYPTAVANPNGQLSRRTDKSYESPKLSMVETWSILLSQLKATTATIKHRFDERACIEKNVSARTDDWCINIFLETHKRLEQLTSELEMQLAITQNVGRNQSASALSTFSLSPWQMEERYRALIQMQSYLGSFFERASPAYDQSLTVWWFDPS